MLNIVVTGGPSSGKTSVLNKIKEEFKELGYKTIIVPETATELINSGIKPFGENALKGIDFQDLVLKTQINKENIAKEAAEILGSEKTIILYDRGTLDGYAYVTPDEWDYVLKRLNYSKRNLLSQYDAVLYLESAKEYFTKENNAARYESDADEALEKGKKVLQSYLSHDNLMVIKPREQIEDKQQEVVNIIHNMLGNPTQLKEQRKFLVDNIDIDRLGIIANKVIIRQDYLELKDDIEYRIRKVSQENDVSYHYNVQRKNANGKREIIKERTLSEREYEILLGTKSEEFKTIEKIRYSFVYKEQYYKLDIFDSGLKILEVNVTKENPKVYIPEFVDVIEEVTDNPDYRNIIISRGRETSYGKRKVNNN